MTKPYFLDDECNDIYDSFLDAAADLKLAYNEKDKQQFIDTVDRLEDIISMLSGLVTRN